MNVLIVCGGNFPGGLEKISIYRAFIYDQAKALIKQGVKVDYFLIKGKGITGYLINIIKLKRFLKNKNYDIIHAHSGLSGFVVSFATNKKFIVTYHGSDINLWKNKMISLIPIIRSSKNIFVSKELREKSMIFKNKSIIIPCGVDLDFFKFINQDKAKRYLKIKSKKKIILFSSSFNNLIKNFSLAKKSIDKLNYKVEFLEIKNKTRKQVMYLLNAADVLLLTSFSEGSPQIIKEALACNCPIVSVDVGDVKYRIEKSMNCFIASPDELSSKLDIVLRNNQRSNGRQFVDQFNNSLIAKKLIEIYKKIK